MAHRVQYDIQDGICIPQRERIQIHKIKKDIAKIKEAQQTIKYEYERRFQYLERRIYYGRNKIFSPNKLRTMSISQEIAKYDLEIYQLRKRIEKEEMMKTASDDSVVVRDPQQKIIDLTHEIMKLKKSVQEIKSKYNDNFTEYAMKSNFEKLRAENEQLKIQLRQIDREQMMVNNVDNIVDYSELENVKQTKNAEILLKQKKLLQQYLKNQMESRNDEQRRLGSQQKKNKGDLAKDLQYQLHYYNEQNSILEEQIQHLNQRRRNLRYDKAKIMDRLKRYANIHLK